MPHTESHKGHQDLRRPEKVVMIPAREPSDADPRVVVHLAKGAVVSGKGAHGEWSGAALLSRGAGYVASGSLKTVSNDTAACLP